MEKYKLAIIGCGSLGSIIGKVVSEEMSENYELLGVISGKNKNAVKLGEQLDCKAYKSLDEMIEDNPDYIVEAASGQVFKEIVVKVLSNNINLIPLSVGALADSLFYNKIKQVAVKNNSRIHIPAGAVGGFDVLKSAAFMEDVSVSITTEKSPKSLNGAPFLKDRTLSEEKIEEIFTGSAEEAIQEFPENVNVAVATALATIGVDKTKVSINSIPRISTNKHKIKLAGDSIKVEVIVETTPAKENPKSSTLAAYSVINLLQNLVAPITF